MNAGPALSRTVLLSRDFASEDVPDEVIVSALLQPHVCIVADEANLRSCAAQSAVVTLATLCMASGATVNLAFPDVELLGPQPPLTYASLKRGVIDLARDRIPGVHALAARPSAADDLVFIIGDSPWRGDTPLAWRLVADEWSGGLIPAQEHAPHWSASFPIGGLIAAVMAAAEPYKLAMRMLPGSWEFAEQLAAIERAQFSLALDGMQAPRALDLGRLDVVSGGAITTSMLHGLLRVDGLRGQARVIEPDRADLTNLNRYPLLRRSSLGLLKAVDLQRWQSDAFSIEALPLKLEPATLPRIKPLASRVIVGTDAIPPRWHVQAVGPAWLAVGATAHFLTLTSEHRSGLGCAGCLHPTDDNVNADIPTVAFVSYWAGLLLAARLLWSAIGKATVPDHQALNLWPLRMDLPRSAIWQPVRQNPTCPVGAIAT